VGPYVRVKGPKPYSPGPGPSFRSGHRPFELSIAAALLFTLTQVVSDPGHPQRARWFLRSRRANASCTPVHMNRRQSINQRSSQSHTRATEKPRPSTTTGVSKPCIAKRGRLVVNTDTHRWRQPNQKSSQSHTRATEKPRPSTTTGGSKPCITKRGRLGGL